MKTVKNTHYKQLTFPLIEVSIQPNEEKKVTDEQAIEMLKNANIEEKTVLQEKIIRSKVDQKLITNKYKK